LEKFKLWKREIEGGVSTWWNSEGRLEGRALIKPQVTKGNASIERSTPHRNFFAHFLKVEFSSSFIFYSFKNISVFSRRLGGTLAHSGVSDVLAKRKTS
jgi:hypothetical protein